ncbi:hypothetical protein B0T17DRAFT_613189 [Bombardia bombarda]|uniref:Uncharacterized protein n=1 Tax=Bombardia bombarda TaxID=252184 RepID=A0AA39XND2_9PEZI|nr:hypothetical protein B0T17DRAFT_613189 [Bombardia bombarda]
MSGSLAPPIRIPALPVELEVAILQHFVPTGPVTTRDSVGEHPQLTLPFREFGPGMAQICQTNYRFAKIATPFLYRVVVLKDMTQLLCFFRTLATVPPLRNLVRTVIWAGVMAPPSSTPTQTQTPSQDTSPNSLMALVGDTWLSPLICTTFESSTQTHWPPTDKLGQLVTRKLELTKPAHFCSGHILGAVLALCPNLAALFTVLGQTDRMVMSPKGRVLRRCPEFPGLVQIPEWDLFQYLDAPVHGNTSVPYPLACQFLLSSSHPSNLRSITIEPHSDRNAEMYWAAFALEPLLRSCPLIKNIEIKGGMSWRELRPRGWGDHRQQQPSVLGRAVRQLVLTRATRPEDNMATVADMFPGLRALYAEFVETGAGTSFRAPAAGFQAALAGLRGTLEVLHLTSAPGETWRFLGVPSLLCPVLGQMGGLKHLVADAVWLFGRQMAMDGVAAVDGGLLLLPPSLVSLHVIDFWGVAAMGGGREGGGMAEEATAMAMAIARAAGAAYYPVFPGQTSPLEFMARWLGDLLVGCETHLTVLKAVRVTSPLFAGLRQTETISSVDVQMHVKHFKEAFGRVGVEFSVSDERAEHGQWEWSSIAY